MATGWIPEAEELDGIEAVLTTCEVIDDDDEELLDTMEPTLPKCGTAMDANSKTGAYQIPKPTINIIANISTAAIALGSLTLDISGPCSIYIFLMIHA
jgi:hypothetical protein